MATAADILLRGLENLEDDEASGRPVDRETLGDIGHALGVFDRQLPVLSAHLNRIVLKLNDKDSR